MLSNKSLYSKTPYTREYLLMLTHSHMIFDNLSVIYVILLIYVLVKVIKSYMIVIVRKRWTNPLLSQTLSPSFKLGLWDRNINKHYALRCPPNDFEVWGGHSGTGELKDIEIWTN